MQIMAFPPRPNYSKAQINRAGALIASLPNPSLPADEVLQALEVVNTWRACHAYPINTFQATLRRKVGTYNHAIVAQRLKRLPTIIDKLHREPEMQLARMQDIGGVRGIVDTVTEVRELERIYENTSFQHELKNKKDYILHPKADGYRGVHLIYQYRNSQADSYNGLLLELQLRTKLQHTWSTAVETMGTFLGQALKSQRGDAKWRKFFAATSAAFALDETCPPGPGFEELSRPEVDAAVVEAIQDINGLETIKTYNLAVKTLMSPSDGQGRYYHLITLDSQNRSVEVRSYRKDQLSEATSDYAKAEAEAREHGKHTDQVLVAAGTFQQLKRAYPNYFLDVNEFIKKVEDIDARS